MKIALIIENSQAAKSQTVHAALKSVAEPQGHTVSHYGMYGADDDASLTYVMNGLLAGLLINSGAADFVVEPVWDPCWPVMQCQVSFVVW